MAVSEDYRFELLKAEHIPGVLKAANQLHEESRFSVYGMNQQVLRETLQQYVEDITRLGMVVSYQGEVVGGILAHVERCFANAARMAYDDILYVIPEHRNQGIAKLLIDIYITWCLDQGINSINMTAGSGITPEKTEQLFLSKGFKPTAVIYEYQAGD